MADNRESQALKEAGRHYHAGDSSQAEKICRRILKHNKRSADALQLLGLIAFNEGQWTTASSCYKKCIALRPQEPRFHYLLAKVSTAQGRHYEALARYDRALKLRPDYASAIAWKAVVFERLGEFDQARILLDPFVTAGTEDVVMAEVYAKLELQAGRPEQAIETIARQLAKPGLAALSREVLLFLKGKAHEASGDHDDAFEAYRQANAHQDSTFDPEAYAESIERLVKAFSRDRLAALPRARDESDPVVFIAGMPRSGTSLVEQIIDAHPSAHGAGEIRDMEEMARSLPSLIQSSLAFPECIQDLTQRAADKLAGRYLERVTRLAPEAARVVDKSLENYKLLGLVALLLPGARVIHCRRDPLDTCLSCYASHLMPPKHAYASDLRHIAFVYRHYERLMRHWRTVLDLRIMEVPYEDLVGDQERTSREIISFCGLDWDEGCLRFHRSKRVAMTLSYDQVRQPIYRSSLGRSQRFERHLGPLKDALSGAAGPQGE